jgi:hypothetical protein
MNLDISSHLPIGSPHTPPETQTPLRTPILHKVPCQNPFVFANILSGFHQVALRSSPDGLRLKELKEYSVSYSAPDYLGPVLESKCLVMQTLGNYLGLGPLEETSESMFQVATRTFNLLY